MAIKYFLVRKRFKSFKELCKVINNHYDLMEWYKYNKIKWPDDKGKDPNDKIFEWPDYIIKSKVGLCWDHAIFSYYWCKNHNIKPYMVIIQSIYEMETEYWCLGHVVNFYEINGEFYMFDYRSNRNESRVLGPFKASNIDILLEKFAAVFKVSTDTEMKDAYMVPYNSNTFYLYATPGNKLDEIYDKFYNDRNIIQNEFIDKYIVPRMKRKYSNYPDFRNKNIKHTEIEQFAHGIKTFFSKIKDKFWSK